MSTLKTNTIQHLTSGFNNVVAHTDGAGTANATHCRAWVFFNGTGTVAINGSFNVSSITDNGVGTWTANLTNALSDANYAVVMSSGWAALNCVLGSYTSSAVPVVTGYFTNTAGNASGADNSQVYIAVFR